jgi:acyl carrier protein
MSDLTLLHKRLTDLFEQEMNIQVPTVETDLFETAVMDSLTFTTLVVSLEKRFGLTVSPDDLELDNFRSVEKIAQFVWKRARTSPAAERLTAMALLESGPS